jgi:hypothetical protein
MTLIFRNLLCRILKAFQCFGKHLSCHFAGVISWGSLEALIYIWQWTRCVGGKSMIRWTCSSVSSSYAFTSPKALPWRWQLKCLSERWKTFCILHDLFPNAKAICCYIANFNCSNFGLYFLDGWILWWFQVTEKCEGLYYDNETEVSWHSKLIF